VKGKRRKRICPVLLAERRGEGQIHSFARAFHQGEVNEERKRILPEGKAAFYFSKKEEKISLTD